MGVIKGLIGPSLSIALVVYEDTKRAQKRVRGVAIVHYQGARGAGETLMTRGKRLFGTGTVRLHNPASNMKLTLHRLTMTTLRPAIQETFQGRRMPYSATTRGPQWLTGRAEVFCNIRDDEVRTGISQRQGWLPQT